MQQAKMLPTSMGDIQRRFSAIPYGWRDIDIAGVFCSLVSLQKVSLHYSGSVIQPTDKRIPDYLRKRGEIDKTIVKKREVLSPALIKASRDFLKEYFNTMDVPSDEDGLIAYVLEKFTSERERFQALLRSEYAAEKYPDKAVPETGVKLCDELLSQKKDNTALLKKLTGLEDDFLDLNEDMAQVTAFFKNQRPIFDSAVSLLRSLSGESDYLQAEPEAIRVLAKIKTILAMPKPYQSIAELPNLMQTVRGIYEQLLDLKKQDVYAEIQAAMGEIHQTAKLDQQSIVDRADAALAAKKAAAAEAGSLTQLDAMKIQIGSIRQQYLKALVVVETPNVKSASASRGSICYTAKLESEADIDKYVADIKEKLLALLDGNDVLHII